MTHVDQPLSSVVAPDALNDAYRRALDMHSIISISDTRGKISYANKHFCRFMGYERAELIGQTYKLLSSGVHDEEFFDSIWQTADSGKTWVGEVCNRAKDGTLLWFNNIVIPLFDDHGVVTAHMSVRKNITSRKLAEQKLQQSERFLASVAEVSRIGGWSLEVGTQTIYWSDQTREIHELPADYTPSLEEAITYYAPEAQSTITHAVENTINTGESWDLELPMTTAKGNPIWVRTVGHLLKTAGQASMLVGALQDVTERKRVETALRQEIQQRHSAEQLLRDVLETIPDAVAAYDEDDRLLICNRGYRQTYAASVDAIVPGAKFEDIIRFGLARGQYADAGETGEEREKWLKQRLKDHKNPPEQINQKLRDGTWLQVREHRSPTGTTVGVRTDITAMKRAEEKMRRFAEEDPLTGLFNRSRFFLALDDIRANASSQQFGCVVLFDIDHFKPINDAYGHNVGDEVLTAIAERMRSILGPNDVGARLGGDEFVFALIDKGDQGACDAILQHLSDLMDHPIETSSGPLKLSLSIGAAPFVDGSINSHDLLKHADLAQYLAKERGRAQWCWFTDEDRRELDHNAKLGRMLSESLNTNKGMDCSFTPIAEASNGGALGFSAELSWSHDGEVISAQSLRQLAQKSSQSARLSIQELSQAFEVAGAQEVRGIDVGDIWVAVNADRLKIAHFADRLHELGETYGIPPKQITVAVEEKAFSERSASAIETTLKAIKSSGIQIAIDQFGSAASSLVKLVSLGIDKVRLSSDVTDPLADPTVDDTVVRGLVGIAKTFQIEVYAISPQTPAHAARLADLGCHGLQGGIVGASLSSEAVPDYLGAVALRTLEGMSNDMRALSANSSNKASEDAA